MSFALSTVLLISCGRFNKKCGDDKKETKDAQSNNSKDEKGENMDMPNSRQEVEKMYEDGRRNVQDKMDESRMNMQNNSIPEGAEMSEGMEQPY